MLHYIIMVFTAKLVLKDTLHIEGLTSKIVIEDTLHYDGAYD